MSEETSYSATAYLGEAGRNVIGALRRRDIVIRDVQAWSTARERSEALQKALEAELSAAGTSTDLAAHCPRAAVRDPGKELALAGAMLAAFTKVPVFSQAAQCIAPHEGRAISERLDALKASLHRDHASPEEVSVQARSLQARIEVLASRAHECLCQAEQEVLLQTTSDALTSLGYLVEHRAGAIRATRGQSCLWVQTSPLSELQMDFSNLSGMACIQGMHEVERELDGRGVVLRNTGTKVHNRPEGGALTGRLSAMFPQFRAVRVQNSGASQMHRQTLKGGV